MLLIPWKYIKEQLYLLKHNPDEIEKKLNCCGLETKLISRGGNMHFEFYPLPNRPDLLSWWGIIHEIAVLLNCKIKPINLPVISEEEQKLIELAITTDNCLEFRLGLIKNVEIKESPSWLKEWLEANNIRSINNVIDIANLVMLESGQPFHAFDYDLLLKKQKIVVREAQKGEVVTTLQGQKLILSPEDMVISSGEKVISLAGIIGTQEAVITSQTKNIFIECADFNPQTIKKTTNRLDTSTLASQYFGRRANLTFSSNQSLPRIISLIIESYGGDLNSGTIFTYKTVAEKQKQSTITISQEFIEKKVGQVLTEQVLENIWQQLDFFYQKEGNIYHIIVPSHRLDITSMEDLLEEILKIYDYNKINGSLTNEFKVTPFAKNDKSKIENKKIIRTYLANCGWQEIITYSLISQEMKEECKEEIETPFYQLLMPKSEYHKYYRQTLIPSHLKAINYNFSRGNKNLSFFEISSVYGPSQRRELLILSGTGKLTYQPLHKLVHEIDFYWIKGVLENIFNLWQIEQEISFSPAPYDYLSSQQRAEIFLNGGKIGFLGRIHPQIAGKYQVNQSIFVAQISLTGIFDYLNKLSRKFQYRSVSPFPTSEKDLSFVFSENVNYSKVIEEIKRIAGDNLQEANVFDVYQNAELEKEKKKSVSFHLIFQNSLKTLENKEVEKIVGDITKKIERLFGAKIRN